ncbi:MAG: hypothetical protein WD992_02625 [Candidatus Levyibacteriota bacterium]
MATLSSTTAWTRKIIKLVSIGAGAILAVILLYRIAVFVKQQITPPPPPTVAFGKLPEIAFPQNQTDEILSYSIDTITGALPVFPDRANVYKTIAAAPELLALNNAIQKVSGAGFEGPYTQTSETLYEWNTTDTSALPKKMVFNIFSSDFNVTSPFLSDSKVLSANNLPNETAAVSTAQDFLSGMSSLPQDVDREKTQVSLFSIKNGMLAPSTSLSNTQVIEVSFFQRDLNGLSVVYPDAKASTMNVFVAGGDRGPQVVQADFFHQNIASESATYPIMTSQEAFDRLKNGEIYIASYDGQNKKISINEVFLAYYLSGEAQEFVLPVVVFQGNNGFTAYTTAVKDDWIQK